MTRLAVSVACTNTLDGTRSKTRNRSWKVTWQASPRIERTRLSPWTIKRGRISTNGGNDLSMNLVTKNKRFRKLKEIERLLLMFLSLADHWFLVHATPIHWGMQGVASGIDVICIVRSIVKGCSWVA
mmetsp:Transcript_11080/g.20566  ORF Transcript_11080/g.20566 Transcript_11080/m.20566 type:complete len:127 (-) Transcript_11080:1260-1640(-)